MIKNSRSDLLKPVALLAVSLLLISCTAGPQIEESPPNIIFIMSDDLSWGDLGVYGQEKIQTPNIDRIGTEGMRFTQAYSGASVCAPARSSLMQGLHQGHARVRGNSFRGYRESLQEGDFTVAMMLQEAGYKTGLFGKWGLALHNQPGIPNNMGFDEFFGYLNQRQAHTYYPEFLYHNEERVYFPENADHFEYEHYSRASHYDEDGLVSPNGINENPSSVTYSADIIAEKSLEFVRENQDSPFFLYLPYTIPHGPLIAPDLGEYNDKEGWAIQHKEWAAMISRMDMYVGDLLNLLDDLGLDENTVIFFVSDNGDSAGYEERYLEVEDAPRIMDFFYSHSPTRGRKGQSYDGAFHVPAMVRWPARIGANLVSAQIWAFWDFMPTAAEIAGIEPPSDIDGISILPTLLGQGKQEQHDYLYWEANQNQAVRDGRWFAHRANGGEVELYDLPADPQQSNDLSDQFPGIAERMSDIMDEAHIPSDVWISPGETEEEFQQRLEENMIPERPENVALF